MEEKLTELIREAINECRKSGMTYAAVIGTLEFIKVEVIDEARGV